MLRIRIQFPAVSAAVFTACVWAAVCGTAQEHWKPLSEFSLAAVQTEGTRPEDHAATILHLDGHTPIDAASRGWRQREKWWDATNLAYHPLYFEDELLERQGYGHRWAEPALSAAHFFGRIPALPYLIGADPPRKCVYALGYHRPGTCTEPYRVAWPHSVRGALMEAGTVTGLIFLIP